MLSVLSAALLASRINFLAYMFGPMSVPLTKTRFPVDWRLLVEDCITNIGIPLDVFLVFCFVDILPFEFYVGV